MFFLSIMNELNGCPVSLLAEVPRYLVGWKDSCRSRFAPAKTKYSRDGDFARLHLDLPPLQTPADPGHYTLLASSGQSPALEREKIS
jgi:hypothetical protein